MHARLFCKTGELAGSGYDIAQEATIGRLNENEITLFASVISGQHARIFFDETEKSYFVEDLGSSNGTLLDGIVVDEPMRLDGLNIITFANDLDFIFLSQAYLPDAVVASTPAPAQPAAQHTPAAEDPHEKTLLGNFGAMPSLGSTEPEDDPHEKTLLGGFGAMPSLGSAETEDDPLERTQMNRDFNAMPSLREPNTPPNAASLGDATILSDSFGLTPPAQTPPQQGVQQATGPSPFTLSVLFESGTNRTFPLNQGENTIGRTDSSDIQLPDDSVSRNHALLKVQNGRVFLIDHNSKNGSYINRQKVKAETEIQPGTTIKFGHQVLATLGRV